MGVRDARMEDRCLVHCDTCGFFRWFEEWKIDEIIRRLFIVWRSFVWIEILFVWSENLWFHFKGVENVFCCWLWLYRVSFQLLLKDLIFLCQFFARYIDDTGVIKALIIESGKWSQCMLLVVYFWWKFVMFLFEWLGALCDAKWHRCDMNPFFMLLVKKFI